MSPTELAAAYQEGVAEGWAAAFAEIEKAKVRMYALDPHAQDRIQWAVDEARRGSVT